MAGDRRAAEAHYRRVRATRDYDTDLAAAREAERRAATPMTATGRTLVLGMTAYDSGRYREAVARLAPVLADGAASPTERAEAAYRTGRAHHALREWDAARRAYRLASEAGGDPLARWGPWARFHEGEVLESTGDAAGARAAYEAVLADEREFDHSKSLEGRARAALDRLGT
jgi:predicted negative regulator of RcsB-dependent stress response